MYLVISERISSRDLPLRLVKKSFTSGWVKRYTEVPADTPACSATGLPAGLTLRCTLSFVLGADDTRYVCVIAGTISASAATGLQSFLVTSSALNQSGQATTSFNITVR